MFDEPAVGLLLEEMGKNKPLLRTNNPAVIAAEKEPLFALFDSAVNWTDCKPLIWAVDSELTVAADITWNAAGVIAAIVEAGNVDKSLTVIPAFFKLIKNDSSHVTK